MDVNLPDPPPGRVRKRMQAMNRHLGLEAELLESRNSLWTAREICQQPRIWRKAHARIEASRHTIDAWLEPLPATPNLRIFLCGAGSSAFIGETIAAWLRKQEHRPASGSIAAVHTTDLTGDPTQFLGKDLPTLMISFARSGDSPESVACLDLADQLLSRCHHLVLTCNPEGRLAKASQARDNALCLTMPAETNDRGFAMTSSYTAMLVSCLAIFTPDSGQMEQAALWAERLLNQGNAGIASLAQGDFRRIAVLGAGSLLGAAREAALKCLELTAGQVVAIHDTPLGFRHGPKIIIDDTTLIIHMRSNDPHTRLYDRDLLSELRTESPSTPIVELSPAAVAGEPPPDARGASALEDAWLSLVYLVFCQVLAFHKAMALGVAADAPCPSGEVNRVVTGVTIYPLVNAGKSERTESQFLYGLDIGGSKTEFAVFDPNLKLIHSVRAATPTDDYEGLLKTVKGFVDDADKRFETTGAVGVGLPGIIDPKGKSLAVNVPCLTGREAKADLTRVLQRSVEIVNDGRALALSEAHGGAAEGRRCMIGASLGTGAAGGYCIGGRLQAGKDGIAGEWGHIPIAASVRKRHGLPLHVCRCGATGCIECYVSGPGMSRIHEHVTGAPMPTVDIVGGMRRGESASNKVFDIWIDCLASSFAAMVLHINPDIIVIGGGLSGISEIYQRLPAVLSGHLLSGIEPPVIAPAEFGAASGVRGAAIVGAQGRGWTGARASFASTPRG